MFESEGDARRERVREEEAGGYHKYVYPQGSVLESTWMPISRTVLQFTPDIQGRLLDDAVHFLADIREIIVVYKDKDTKAIVPMGRVIRKFQAYQYGPNLERTGYSNMPELAEVVRFEVPDKYRGPGEGTLSHLKF